MSVLGLAWFLQFFGISLWLVFGCFDGVVAFNWVGRKEGCCIFVCLIKIVLHSRLLFALTRITRDSLKLVLIVQQQFIQDKCCQCTCQAFFDEWIFDYFLRSRHRIVHTLLPLQSLAMTFCTKHGLFHLALNYGSLAFELWTASKQKLIIKSYNQKQPKSYSTTAKGAWCIFPFSNVYVKIEKKN